MEVINRAMEWNVDNFIECLLQIYYETSQTILESVTRLVILNDVWFETEGPEGQEGQGPNFTVKNKFDLISSPLGGCGREEGGRGEWCLNYLWLVLPL